MNTYEQVVFALLLLPTVIELVLEGRSTWGVKHIECAIYRLYRYTHYHNDSMHSNAVYLWTP